jgi:acetoacetyl-CoA synthetase
VAEGTLLWTPSPERVAGAKLTAFIAWLGERGHHFDSYAALWQWSVTDLEGFWQAIWDYSGIEASVPPERVLGSRAMPGAQWFPGARLNYAQHILRRETPGQVALLSLSETAPLAGLDWADLAGQTRILATRLRAMGVRPGDRVASYLPNIPQTVIAMLATTSIGAIWTSVSPDFGWRGVLDRFRQLAPKVLFCVDGYRYNGRYFDRRGELREIISGLNGLEQVIWLPGPDAGAGDAPAAGALRWDEVLDHPPVPASEFSFEQVPFDHPLFILFSSGTTGLPKAIMHGHGGILIEQLKLQPLHMDLGPTDRLFFFTTTGWMMWNFLVSSLLAGVVPVLYDGSPAYPKTDVLWQLAQDAGVTFFGASPSFVDLMAQAGVVPGDRYDLTALRTIMPAGSPVSAEHTAWFYRNVKKDVSIATGSGGTDVCTGFVGGVPTEPVRAGEIQARHLGVAARAFNERGESVVDEVGELVITEPMPSMPVGFWGDGGDSRYRESYFDRFPGVWRQGDFFRINSRGACFVLGRSDATLNRHGVRIGTAEVYRVLASVAEVTDALIVNLELPGGGFFMPLFVRLADGVVLDEALDQRIRDRLRTEYTPRHVPDRIIAVPEIPVTLTGKKMEVPVRKILRGVPAEEAVNRNAMAHPESLDFFIAYAAARRGPSLPRLFSERPCEARRDDQVGGRQVGDRGAAQGEHRGVDAAAQDIEHVADACLAVRREPPQVGASDQHRAGSQRQCLDDIAAPADAAVEQDFDLVADGGGDRRQQPDAGRRAVEVVAAVGGDRERGNPGIDGPLGVVHAGDALEHEGLAPLLAQPREIVPGGRRRLHPVAVGAEERGCRVARRADVRHGQAGQPSGPGVPEQISRSAGHFGREARHLAQAKPLGYPRAAPVPAVRERPVRCEDQPDRACRSRPLDTACHLVPGADPEALEEGLRVGRHDLLDRLGRERAQAHHGAARRGRRGHRYLGIRVHGLNAGR